MKTEQRYNAEKLIELLVSTLDVLNETIHLNNRKEKLIFYISNKCPNKPTEEKTNIPEIPAKPEYIRENRGIFFKFLHKLDDSIYAIGMVVSIIFLLSFLFVSFQQHEYLHVTYMTILILSCISFVFFLSLFIVKKIVMRIDEKDQNKELKNKLLMNEYNNKQQERDRIIRNNENVDWNRKEYLEKLRFYNDHVINWEKELNHIEQKIMLNEQCIDEALDFVPQKYRSYETIASLVIILKNRRADTFKEAINIYEKDRALERLLKFQK